ncbi:MAG: ABC transporter ATP-binding protein [Methanomicrobiaceae archaeon]|nr:ABC transporter ATP-binding protein [Methanomicrobiaceae archaeon]
MMIEFNNVCLQLGDFHLHDVCLKVGKGEYYFILGPSGAGKTVILEAIAGLHASDSGTVRIRGKDAGAMSPEKRNVALVYQDYSLFPHMTVYDNIAFGLRMKKLPPGEIARRVHELLASFGIEGLKDRHPLTMSGGEQQRVAIARALAVEPDILLLDEPLAALDPITKETFIGELRDLHRKHGLTIVQVTHSRGEALQLATRVGVIIEGSLVAEGETATVFARPVTKQVAQFVGVDNILDGVVVRNHDGIADIDVNGEEIKAQSDHDPGDSVTVCLRAENVGLSRADTGGEMKNVLKGVVTDLNPKGPVVRVGLDCGFPLAAMVFQKTIDELKLCVGDTVFAIFDAWTVHLAEPEGVC